MHFFITAIGTDSGKTLVSILFARALGAYYWKPVQAGEPTDSAVVRSLGCDKILPEHVVLRTPASPHYAAALENITLRVSDFTLPDRDPLIVEGAGGMMVPLNDHELVIDLAAHWNMPVVLVCNLYLGSINHSLLSIDYLKRRDIPVAGIVFNGRPNHSSEQIIEKYCPWPVLLRIPELPEVSQQKISELSAKLARNLKELQLI